MPRLNPTQPNLPTYGLDVVAKFQAHTRASFMAKYGNDVQPFVHGKPIKRWRDDAASPSVPNPREFCLYKVATGPSGGFTADKDGFVEPTDIGMSAAEAWDVNIPPDIGLGTVPGTTPTSEVRMPLELLPNERLQQAPFGGVLRVRRVDVPEAPAPATAGGSFTESDRAALYACVNLLKDLKAGK